ncbi:MAG TPA: ATP-binding protein, partial [Actinomycetota bacterium]|nr:ATP-binding protein [Actinomycetota bacterium]
VVALTDTCVAVLGAKIVWHDPSVVWLLAIPAALLFLAYRLYTGQRQKHATLEVLYEAARRFQGSLRIEETVETLLAEAREMFRAEVAVMTIFPAGKGERAVRTILGPGDGSVITEPLDLDPREGVWARVAAEAQPVLLPRPIQNARIREHFAGQGIRDAMVAPLLGDPGVVGTMLVGNRLGDVSTFDEEDLRLFETLTSQASIALQNARLVARLEESLAHLTEMNRLKDDFVATVSHELRTPLTNIQGSVKTLLRLDLSEADRQDLLEAADRGGDRLRQLIEDLLMASRIESRELRIVVHRVQVLELLHSVAREVNLEGNGRRLELRVAGALPTIETDEGKLSQILTNLIDNARKYSDEGSTVVVEASSTEDGIRVGVTNRGIPIPGDQHDRIFDRFFQVDQSSTRPHGGAGLGLYICRKLADAVGGRVWLHRSDEDGTEFRLFVPQSPPRGALREEYEPLPRLT